ncbi:hypothetical protein [Photorhabdus cinerea]|uniref:hypothetical protein n=1 Tax=Photorhabdus cinerea TaxID=471575 RepID=UPI00140833F3|nr:hypothetical protein [Photorhabdus cinerea]
MARINITDLSESLITAVRKGQAIVIKQAAKNVAGFIPLNVTVEHSISYYDLPFS